MKKPYIICHMMTSLDGRIDCAMTEQLPGVDDYYQTLEALNVPTTVTGRVTAQLQMACPGEFQDSDPTPVGKEVFSKKADAPGYEVVVDTYGRLLWPDAGEPEKPLLILTSEQVPQEYLSYLDGRTISWIATGKERIDLARAAEILAAEFGVERLAVVGGSAINTAFLDAGLLDEVSILIGAGIDGRGNMPAVFDGRAMDQPAIPLRLTDVQKSDSGAVWLRYFIR